MACTIEEPIDEEPCPWPIEEIPSEDLLFMRVHRNWYTDGNLELGCFRNRPNNETGGMSTEWRQYSTPERCRPNATSPEMDNLILSLEVEAVRKIGTVTDSPDQEVRHTPICDQPGLANNRAHADVFGPKNTRTRLQYGRIYKIVLPLVAD